LSGQAKHAPQPTVSQDFSYRPTKEQDGREVLDLEAYIPNFLTVVTNAWSRGSSQRYRKEFGINILEWRVISYLATVPRVPAVKICDAIKHDKGQVSRALTRLAEIELVECEVTSADIRKKDWWLNAAGYDMHARVLQVALERESKLIAGCDAQDIQALIRVMRQMRENVSNL
jgi:DNA-binding MarR family transcriptional regulator